LIGAFYYLRVVKTMYFDEPEAQPAIAATCGQRGIMSLNGIAIMALGILPGGLLAVCINAISGSLGL